MIAATFHVIGESNLLEKGRGDSCWLFVYSTSMKIHKREKGKKNAPTIKLTLYGAQLNRLFPLKANRTKIMTIFTVTV